MTGSRRVRALVGPVVAGLLLVAPASSLAASTDLPPDGTVVGGGGLAAGRILTDLAPGTPAPPVPKAASWLVADLRTHQILVAHHVHHFFYDSATM